MCVNAYIHIYIYKSYIIITHVQLGIFVTLIIHKNIFITSITKIAKNNCIFYVFIHQNKHTSTNKRSLKVVLPCIIDKRV